LHSKGQRENGYPGFQNVTNVVTDHTNGRACYSVASLCRLSSSVRNVLWLNGAS